MGLIGWFGTFLGIGLFMGNIVFIYMGLIGFFIFLIGLIIDQPYEVTIERSEIKEKVWSGSEAEIELKVKIENGIGPVIVRNDLPGSFELVEGSNVRLLWKGLGVLEENLTFRVRFSKRGFYTIQSPKWRSDHPLLLREEIENSTGKEEKIVVRPRPTGLEKARGRKNIAYSPFPREDVAKIGVETTDFKEIREYQPSDPVRKINWKATARLYQSIDSPLVNEYESEGKRAVWLFLNSSPALSTGTFTQNMFDYAVRATNATIRYFTERGYRVGMYIYNNEKQMHYPASGKKQHRKLLKELIDLEVSEGAWEGLEKAAEECKSYLTRYKPYTVIITSLTSESGENLENGFKKIHKLVSRRRTKTGSILFVNVLPHHLNPTPPSEYKEYAGQLYSMEQSSLERKLRNMGASIVDWDPVKKDFSKTLLQREMIE